MVKMDMACLNSRNYYRHAAKAISATVARSQRLRLPGLCFRRMAIIAGMLVCLCIPCPAPRLRRRSDSPASRERRPSPSACDPDTSRPARVYGTQRRLGPSSHRNPRRSRCLIPNRRLKHHHQVRLNRPFLASCSRQTTTTDERSGCCATNGTNARSAKLA